MIQNLESGQGLSQTQSYKNGAMKLLGKNSIEEMPLDLGKLIEYAGRLFQGQCPRPL
jgi:hypothetical protein